MYQPGCLLSLMVPFHGSINARGPNAIGPRGRLWHHKCGCSTRIASKGRCIITLNSGFWLLYCEGFQSYWMLLKLFALNPPNSWFPMSCCCCCWCNWPNCERSCAPWFIPILAPIAIGLFAIAVLIPWPNPLMAPNAIPPIPELFMTALPTKQLTPLTPWVSPFGVFISFPEWPTPFICDDIRSCKIFWTELCESLGSASWGRVAGGCIGGMLGDVVGELSWFVFCGAGIMLLLDVVGAGEGKEVDGFDCSELVEFTFGIATLPPLYVPPLVLLIGWSCLEFIGWSCLEFIWWSCLEFIEFCKSPTTDGEGADVEGAQLRELFDVTSPLAEAEGCTPAIGAEFWPLWFELWGMACCCSVCCCCGWRALTPEGVLRGKLCRLSE